MIRITRDEEVCMWCGNCEEILPGVHVQLRDGKEFLVEDNGNVADMRRVEKMLKSCPVEAFVVFH